VRTEDRVGLLSEVTRVFRENSLSIIHQGRQGGGHLLRVGRVRQPRRRQDHARRAQGEARRAGGVRLR
jgi:hypothetical protein